MGYKVYKLQNAPGCEKPDIVIQECTPEWEVAYQRWLNGKNPTDSKLWERGVIACTRLIGKENFNDY